MIGKFYNGGFVVAVALSLGTHAAMAQNPVQKWHRLDADNGAAFAVDLNSISRFTDGSSWIITCVLDNDRCPPTNMSRIKFDCRGHYVDLDRRGQLQIAPPRSIAGRMAEIACSDGKNVSNSPSNSHASGDQSGGKAARKALGLCFVTEARSVPYSDEHPKGADRATMESLLERCKAQQERWQAQCLADGREEIWCTTTQYAMIGWALDLLGR